MMASDSVFVGVQLSYGRKPLTFALLDDVLNLIRLAHGEVKDISAFLSKLDSVTLCVTARSKSNTIKSADADSLLHAQLAKMSFRPYSRKNEAHQWFKTGADDSFRALLQKKLLPRRTLEGRIQRALILYDQGLQINDPMDFFEEITRYKLMLGNLPLENIYAANELDALVAAYVAWMTANRSQQIIVKGEFILPVPE